MTTPDVDAPDHADWCDQDAHVDPADGCASAVEDVHGARTHIAGTVAVPLAYAEFATNPVALTAVTCAAWAARFAGLATALTPATVAAV